MRKLLNILSIITLGITPITSFVACKKTNIINPTEFGPYENKKLNNLSIQQRQMVINTSLISKLILLGRHENLNYNINEILSMFLAPNAIAERYPMVYTVTGNGKHGTEKDKKYQINLSRYIDGFTQNMTDLRRIDTITEGYGGIYASYIMGMYKDEIYQNFSKNLRTNNETLFGDISDNKGDFTKPKGFNGGLNTNLVLSSEKSRRNLTWGIQDTGALSNFLLVNGYQGGNAGDTAASSGPKSKPKNLTNYGGYMFYNSHLFNGKTIYSSDDPNEKLKDKKVKIGEQKNYMIQGLTLTKNNKDLLNGQKWGSMQSFISQQGGILNVTANVVSYLSIMNNLSETEIGASAEMEFINSMFPFLLSPKSYSGSSSYLLMSFAIAAFLISLNQIAKISDIDKKKFKKFNLNDQDLINQTNQALKILADQKLINKSGDSYNLPILNLTNGIRGKVISDLVGIDNKGKEFNFFNNFNNIIQKIISISSKWDSQTTKEFSSIIMGDKNHKEKYQWSNIFNLLNVLFRPLYDGLFEKSFVNTLDIIGIFKLLNNTFSAINSNINILKNIKKTYVDINKDMLDWNQLTLEQKRYIIKLFGWDGIKFKIGSILYVIYKSLTDSSQPGYETIQNMLFKSTSPFQTMVKKQMQETQDKFLNNAILDDVWNIYNVKINGDINQIGATMSYIMDYTGNGDPSVTKYTKEQVDVPNNFNPYQQSGIRSDNSVYIAKPLVDMSDEDYIKYDGLGDYDLIMSNKVNHRYKISWKNISGNTDSPYWLITGIECFDINTGGIQFYNIY